MAISKEQHDELCVSYASLILYDGEAEITADAINTVIKGSNNEVEPYWPMLFANVLSKEGKIIELISSGGPGSASASTSSVVASEATPTEAAPEKPAEKEEEEEADLGGGMDMFGGGSDY